MVIRLAGPCPEVSELLQVVAATWIFTHGAIKGQMEIDKPFGFAHSNHNRQNFRQKRWRDLNAEAMSQLERQHNPNVALAQIDNLLPVKGTFPDLGTQLTTYSAATGAKLTTRVTKALPVVAQVKRIGGTLYQQFRWARARCLQGRLYADSVTNICVSAVRRLQGAINGLAGRTNREETKHTITTPP